MTDDTGGRILQSPQALEGARLAHAALEAVITIDHHQLIVMINPAGLSMFGLTSRQALGLELGRLMPERFRKAHQSHVQQFMGSDEIERQMSQRSSLVGLRASGEEFPLEAAIFKSEVLLPTGIQTCCTALLRDLSEQDRANAVIALLNKSMRTVFERAPVAIWITEKDHVVFANRACAELLGQQHAEQLVGRSIFDLLAPEAHVPVGKKLRDLEREEGVSVLVSALKRADGTLREVEMVVAVLPDQEHSYVQMVINDISQRSREKQNLLRSRRALRELSANLVAAREEERRRIARELHDELGQRLTALKLEVAACQRDRPNQLIRKRAQHIQDMLDETVASARRIAMDLRPLMLDDLGLEEALDWLVKEFIRRTGIEVETRLEGLSEISPDLATAIYRIVQEALTNISRHAFASQALVELERQGEGVQLVIHDNGIGYPKGKLARKAGSFGLLGIRERVLMLGGQISVNNTPKGGARLIVNVPLVQTPNSGNDESDLDAGEALFENSTPGRLE